MQWFRMYGEFANDPKVQMMSEVNQRRLVMLFCIRCNGNEALHETRIMFQMRISETEWRETKAEFVRLGFIDESCKLLNWDRRQYRSDCSTERVYKHRASKNYKPLQKRFKTVAVTPPEQIQNRTEQSIKTNIPEWVPIEQWNGFVQMRRRIKAPLTPRAEALAIKELEKLKQQGNEPGAVLDQSVMRGWKGLFEINAGAGQHATNRPIHSAGARKEAIRQERERSEKLDQERAFGLTGDDSAGDSGRSHQQIRGRVNGAASTQPGESIPSSRNNDEILSKVAGIVRPMR